MMSDIVYPHGCKPITEDLGQDELIRRLKNLTNTLQTMGQDEGLYQQYVPLALHFADDYFLSNPSRDVQLLIACCIADFLRVYAPEAPYKDQDQIKSIFMFLIRQLNGLKDPKDPAFKRYFYLLENLAYVKSFNMCFELEDCQEIFCELFSLVFKIVNDEHSSKVKSFMLDVLCPLITESDVVSNELLDIILINIVEPLKSQRKNAYKLAKELILKTSDTLEPYIQVFFNQILVMDKAERNYSIVNKIYDVIYELNVINPALLLSVLPQLECKLKSGHEVERQRSVSLLARLFSEKDSQLAYTHKPLWRSFLGRFYDISSTIRIKCVQSTMHFLLNHPELRADIIEVLKVRQHDADESVRYAVITSIVETAKRDFQVVSESEDLLEFVKERTLDKKYKIRQEALSGLALIYRKYLLDPCAVADATKNAVKWIKNKILHGYYMTGIEDRLLVERLLTTCLVPYQLPATERMKTLFQLLSSIDVNATKAFIELQKNQLKVRKMVFEWVRLHKHRELTPAIQSEMNVKLGHISKQLPEPVKSQEFLLRFSNHMRKDSSLIKDMETILKRDITCRECADTMSNLLKKLGQPIMTNLYYNTVKRLLERIASVMVDSKAISILIELIEQCLEGNPFPEIGIPPESAGERGLKLLNVLSYVFSGHFYYENILCHMVRLLSYIDDYVAPLVLKSLTNLGRYKPIIQSYPKIIKELAPACLEFANSGTPKQAKHAVQCMYVNLAIDQKIPEFGDIFPEIIENLKKNLNASNPEYRTAIVCLGHVAYNLPDRFLPVIKNIISRKIVKELLVKEDPADRPDLPTGDWCSFDDLPEETKCKVEALKTMARWLLGLKNDIASAAKTFRMLTAFIKQNGDLLENKRLAPAEMSWLRLSAGTAMLKICERKGVGDQFSPDQFYLLSKLMIDPVKEVREIFAKKLHKGLSKGFLPNKSLPLDFMGYYALGGRERNTELQQAIKMYIDLDVTRRREYIKSFASIVERGMTELPHILPDYMLLFAICVLSHDPNFTDPTNLHQLKQVEKCLWLVLDPLIKDKEFFCCAFYKNIIDRIKNHRDACDPDDELTNIKIYTICDLSLHLIYSKLTNYETRDFPMEARIPEMYFKPINSDTKNVKSYLPSEYYSQGSGLPKKVLGVRNKNVNYKYDTQENDQIELIDRYNDDTNKNDDNSLNDDDKNGENENNQDDNDIEMDDLDDDDDNNDDNHHPPQSKRSKLSKSDD